MIIVSKYRDALTEANTVKRFFVHLAGLAKVKNIPFINPVGVKHLVQHAILML